MHVEPSQTRPLGRPCVTCASSERVAIEEAMLGGSSLSSISRMFGVDRMALDRHRSRHLAWNPELAREAGLAPETVVNRLVDIATRLDDDARTAWEAGDTTEHRKAAEAAAASFAAPGSYLDAAASAADIAGQGRVPPLALYRQRRPASESYAVLRLSDFALLVLAANST